MITIEGLFIDSYNCFVKSTKNEDVISNFLSAINKGIASIECALQEAANDFNLYNNSKIIDIDKKISLEQKLDDWIPIITKGKFNKSNKIWQDFVCLKNVRDKKDQHFHGGYEFDYEDICNLMNKYKSGIATFLFELERAFNHRISSAIIRAKYYPKITLINI